LPTVKISTWQRLKAPGRKSDLILAAVLLMLFISFEFSDRSTRQVAGHLVCLIGFLWVYLRYLKPADHAVDLLADALKKHGDALPSESDPLAAAEAARDRLERYAEELAIKWHEQQVAMDHRLEDLTKANRDLLTHHRCTKKMLQSFRTEEVFETLLKGVRDGLGFLGATLGGIDREGYLVFHEDNDPESLSLIRVPAWSERSLLARTFWSGNSLLSPSLQEQTHILEDRTLLGEGPSFLLPIVRKQGRSCSEVKSCGNAECSSYLSSASRCWIEHSADCVENNHFLPEDKRKACFQCEMFSPVALLALRSRPESRKISRDTIVPVATLANEASMALEVVELHENMRKMSITDGLTGLFNHREFYHQLRRELERARRYRHTVSLLIIDVDDFKRFNDRFGHLAGDLALRKISDLLRHCARATDIAARYGGEEFAVILPESTSAGALMLAERIKTEVSNCNFLPQAAGEFHLTVSIGIYTAEEGAVSEDQMVSYADEAAYSAKHAGKNCVVMKTHA
jgi:diguanylate cyclase (GGDEF)-like protein